MKFRLRRYKKEFDHSFAFGVFPTLELLKHHSAEVLGVIAHPKGSQNKGIHKIQTICSEREIPFEFQEKTLSRIGARENDYAVGIFQKTELVLDEAANHVILVNPSGLGNLGTIIRTMLGFGHKNLAIIEPAADIFHPDVIRASMGAFFQIRFCRFLNFSSYLKSYGRNIYLLMTNGEITLPTAMFESPYGLVFGPENSGLPDYFQDHGISISIPQTTEIDSFNLAISVGITLYQVSQQKVN
jgi:TrmH family RNA methyltransferase